MQVPEDAGSRGRVQRLPSGRRELSSGGSRILSGKSVASTAPINPVWMVWQAHFQVPPAGPGPRTASDATAGQARNKWGGRQADGVPAQAASQQLRRVPTRQLTTHPQPQPRSPSACKDTHLLYQGLFRDKNNMRTSVVLWVRTTLPTQETRVQCLVQEDDLAPPTRSMR